MSHLLGESQADPDRNRGNGRSDDPGLVSDRHQTAVGEAQTPSASRVRDLLPRRRSRWMPVISWLACVSRQNASSILKVARTVAAAERLKRPARAS